ncbi:DUF3995 domain-containing protein [Spongisporangium articulatum]|uniref:DUF3995 domain-containing protein n=1 Tax=Spongisporangium articulatum TaxID=3362603 RepID=A0ABW8AGP5_9ACTN
MKNLRAARATAVLAAVIGLPYATLNLYWALGGHRWVSDYGTHIIGGTGGFAAVSALLAAGMLVAVVAGLAATGRREHSGWTWTAWAAATGMAAYGAVLVLIGVPDALDAPVYRWHAYLFDPWYLVWGLTLGTALLLAARARESDPWSAVGPRPRALQLGRQS